MTRNRNGYEDITKITPNGVNSLTLLTKSLIQYSLNIGPKKIPRELFPHGLNPDNSIKVIDGSKNLQEVDEEIFNILNPVSFEKRIASLSETADIQVEEIRTEHFGKSYKATSTTFFSKDNGQPIGKRVLYHPTWKQKITGNFFHPDFTFELIGYDREL